MDDPFSHYRPQSRRTEEEADHWLLIAAEDGAIEQGPTLPYR